MHTNVIGCYLLNIRHIIKILDFDLYEAIVII